MARMVKRLRNLDIDEISLVDRPANQHGLVEITKRDEDEMADTLFDADGYQIDQSTLEDGQYVYDEAGNEYLSVAKAAEDIADITDEELDEADLAGRIAARRKRAEAMMMGGGEMGMDPGMDPEMMDDPGAMASSDYDPLQEVDDFDRAGSEDDFEDEDDEDVELEPEDEEDPYGTDQYGEEEDMDDPRNFGKSHRSRRVSKSGRASLGQQVLQNLSKSMNDEDRDAIVSKAIDQIAGDNRRLVSKSRKLEQQLARMEAEREFQQYIDVAKGYGYAPGEDEEIAAMMQTVAKSNPEMLSVLDRVLTSQSEFAKGHLEEIGYSGTGEADVMAQVNAMADEMVTKSEGGFSREQALTELFAANPELYAEYESNQF